MISSKKKKNEGIFKEIVLLNKYKIFLFRFIKNINEDRRFKESKF